MTVIVLDVAPENIRGLITRWMIEVKPGVFIGKISKVVRDNLWLKIMNNSTEIRGGLLIYSYKNAQGYAFEMFGEPYRHVVDLDGVFLISRDILSES